MNIQGQQKLHSRQKKGDLLRLVEALSASDGFSLHICVCNTENIRKKLKSGLKFHFKSSLTIIELENKDHQLDSLITGLSELKANQILLITVFDSDFNSGDNKEAEIESVILALDKKLSEIKKRNCPVVIDIPLSLMNLLIEPGRELWEQQSGIYLFETRQDHYQTATFIKDHFADSIGHQYFAQKRILLTLYQAVYNEYQNIDSDDYLCSQFYLEGKLARINYKLGDYNSAYEYLMRQLKFLKRLDNPYLDMEVLNNLGMTSAAQGRLTEGLDCIIQARDIAVQKIPSDTHPIKAAVLSNLGEIYALLGDDEQAYAYCHNAIQVTERKLGKKHPQLVPYLIKLGKVCRLQVKYDEALNSFRHALHIVEKKLSSAHPYFPVIFQNIGIMYDCQKDYETALRYVYRSLETIEKILGAEHPYIGFMLNKIGLIHFHCGHTKQALQYLNWAMEIRKNSTNADDPLLGDIYTNLANLYLKQGNLKGAREFFQKALEIFRDKLPSHHPAIAAVERDMQKNNLSLEKLT